ncbi:hypothetical protein OS493_003646 [Desmophyllum pertusum]|uniref:Uncharacterized protein n=1 Tax=Desmophyllum pertusum TaxID=174260 RepID=A0A9X0DBL8_9CNID|nr:hypothetical protein OS493_003646 [Desmophyllum pertusum]
MQFQNSSLMRPVDSRKTTDSLTLTDVFSTGNNQRTGLRKDILELSCSSSRTQSWNSALRPPHYDHFYYRANKARNFLFPPPVGALTTVRPHPAGVDKGISGLDTS